MPVVSPERLIELQRNAQDIRNICILAHVDHGKTSLTDALIATNGIISPRMAGKIRYLDSRPDEQLRGITMESSAISLCFSMARRTHSEAPPEQRDYLINLIDSPGHVDFSSEVSTASRLCDGALVLVDAVEGVQSQTVTVLRQAWIEKLRPLLVINKIDRLVWELKMSASEAYTHLSRLVEEVNAVLGSFFQGERMEEDLQWRERMDERIAAAALRDSGRARRNSTDDIEDGASQSAETANDGEFEERDDEDLYFAPERNNIIFCSALDGWAFTVTQFAAIYEKKLGIKRQILEKVLWGDFYLDPKTKRVLSSKHLKGRALKPMFVQLVLDNIWAVYEATTGGGKDKGDHSILEKITKSLSINIPPHILRSKDSRTLLTTVFQQWLPVSTAILVSVIEQLPSPPTAQAERIPGIVASSPGSSAVTAELLTAMSEFKTDQSSPCVAYVSKMVAIPARELPKNRRPQWHQLNPEEAREMARKKRAEIAKARAAAEAKEQAERRGDTGGATEALNGLSVREEETDGAQADEEPEEPDELVGFARLYSGTLHVGDSIYVLPPKYTPLQPRGPPTPTLVKISSLYLLMGRTLEALPSVPAGCVFGIGGLAGHILKNGTLCSTDTGAVNLAGVNMGGDPIVRVALEPVDPRDLSKMITGMKLLEQSDPCARYEVLSSGEHVIATAGELHLERCLKDLRERFARCEIQAGEPIVPYRESIVSVADMPPAKHKDLPRGTVIAISGSRQLRLRLRVRPLPQELTECVEKHAATIRRLVAEQKRADLQGAESEAAEARTGRDGAEDLEGIMPADHDVAIDEPDHEGASAPGTLSRSAFHDVLLAAAAEVPEQAESWRQAVEAVTAFGPGRIGPNLLIDCTTESICRNFWDGSGAPLRRSETAASTSGMLTASDLADRIAYAFQLATAQGPLCLEPLHGVAVFLEDVKIFAAPLPVEADESALTSGTSTPLAAETGGGSGGATATTDSGKLTGEVLRLLRSSVTSGFLEWSPRLLLAMYSCEIQAGAEVLGRVYGVVTRRRGRILAEALLEGTPFFTVVALLPVAESFGFATEMRNRTSGNASPQLRFAGFVALDEDPFWVPRSEEELEDLGELADRANVAKRYVDGVRRRKGLLVKGLRRVEGEKARTLKK